jgi:hypothetical protein
MNSDCGMTCAPYISQLSRKGAITPLGSGSRIVSQVLERRGFKDPMQDPTDAPVRRGFIIIVGAPKCATTMLHRWLTAHPDVYHFRAHKEPRYFTDFSERHWTGPARSASF